MDTPEVLMLRLRKTLTLGLINVINKLLQNFSENELRSLRYSETYIYIKDSTNERKVRTNCDSQSLLKFIRSEWETVKGKLTNLDENSQYGSYFRSFIYILLGGRNLFAHEHVFTYEEVYYHACILKEISKNKLHGFNDQDIEYLLDTCLENITKMRIINMNSVDRRKFFEAIQAECEIDILDNNNRFSIDAMVETVEKTIQQFGEDARLKLLQLLGETGAEYPSISIDLETQSRNGVLDVTDNLINQLRISNELIKQSLNALQTVDSQQTTNTTQKSEDILSGIGIQHNEDPNYSDEDEEDIEPEEESDDRDDEYDNEDDNECEESNTSSSVNGGLGGEEEYESGDEEDESLSTPEVAANKISKVIARLQELAKAKQYSIFESIDNNPYPLTIKEGVYPDTLYIHTRYIHASFGRYKLSLAREYLPWLYLFANYYFLLPEMKGQYYGTEVICIPSKDNAALMVGSAKAALLCKGISRISKWLDTGVL